MRELFFECPPLLLALFKIKAKTFILRLKLRYLSFKVHYLRFKNDRLLLDHAVLIRRQRDALTKNACGAMLGDELFNSVEQQIHSNPPNVDRHD